MRPHADAPGNSADRSPVPKRISGYVAFAIGGAYGLDEAVRRAAARSLQLAPWTLPHELARLVLAEQLYRAGTIARGEPYHK